MRYLIFAFIMTTIAGLGACKNDESSQQVIVNRDPNGTSELQLSMREMYDYFEQVKEDVAAGKRIEDIKVFRHITTDTPTEEGKNTTELYRAMAESYFLAVEQLKKNQDQAAFELIVDTCMNCHRQICPGPMVKIKKLYL